MAINFSHNYPPVHPCGLALKICPHSGAYASQFLTWGWEFVHKRYFTVQAICNIINFSCKKFIPICMNLCKFIQILYINLCTKFVKNSLMNSSTNSHMNSYTKKNLCINSCVNITFLKKGHKEKSISIINIIDLPV